MPGTEVIRKWIKDHESEPRKGKVRILLDKGKREVLADIYGHLCIHKAVGSVSWVVTHIPTGCAHRTEFGRLENAQQYLFGITGICDWSFRQVSCKLYQKYIPFMVAMGNYCSGIATESEVTMLVDGIKELRNERRKTRVSFGEESSLEAF